MPRIRTDKTGEGGHRGWRRTRGLVALVGLSIVTGCQQPTPTLQLSGPERRDLVARSLNLLLVAAESELDEVSCNAIEALVRGAPRDGLPVYRKAIRSTSAVVRFAGFAALGELRDRESLSVLIAGTKDENPQVRLAAAFAAVRCGKDGYTRMLVRALTDAPDEGVRAEAATLLGRIGEPRAKRWLDAALSVPANRRSNRVTIAIYGALARLGDEDGFQGLVYYSQGDAVARTDALLILADLGDRKAFDALRYRLLSGSEDYDETKLIAARGLGRIGNREGYDLAMRMLNFSDPNQNPTLDNPSRTFPVRSMAIHALAEIRDMRSVPALREIAGGEDSRLQVAACYALMRILQG